jgi:FAD/FMN-containing dehydrogenase
MADVHVRSLHGTQVVIPADTVGAFEATLRGSLIRPESAGYDAARSIWNGMVDRRPALIVRCAGPADVANSMRFARAHDLLIAVRGAGHNIAGNAMCDDGIVIDLSAMRSVRVDPATKTARVEAGCTLRDFDHEAQAFGLATPVGINSTTGIAGLTLGGGFGWLTRRHGMTVDNLISADVVTVEGELLHASANGNTDLFWAIRGGGGNFGIVTSFEFQLHDVGPQVLAGLIVHPFDDARAVLDHYRDFTESASADVTAWVVMRKAPPLPFLPQEWHGREVVVIPAFSPAADLDEAAALMKPLREFGNPIADVIGPVPYAAWQQAFDPLLTPGARNYWKSHNFSRLDDGLIDALIAATGQLPGPECEIFIANLGGAAGSVPVDATVYPHREAAYAVNVHTRWQNAADDDTFIAWARSLFDTMSPFATGGVYVNFMPADETERVAKAYGRNFDRLARVKAKYDPDNVLRLNQNIAAPASV